MNLIRVICDNLINLCYRIGDVRIFYKIDDKNIIVFMIDIEWRKDSYK